MSRYYSLGFDEMVPFDRSYIDTCSASQDILLIFDITDVMASGKGVEWMFSGTSSRETILWVGGVPSSHHVARAF